MHEYYELGKEQGRLDSGEGLVEFERTKEIVLRHLPDPPCTVADIGGGPGRYALWLAELGYTVRHRELIPLHVEQLTAAAGREIERPAVRLGRRSDRSRRQIRASRAAFLSAS